MIRTRTLLLPIVTVALGIVPAIACRTNDTPPPTDQAPADTTSAHASHHQEPKEPVDLKPVGIGGGPQESTAPIDSGTVHVTPKPIGAPATTSVKPKTPKPKPSSTTGTTTGSTWTIPFPSTWPSQWWPYPAPSGSATGQPPAGAGKGAPSGTPTSAPTGAPTAAVPADAGKEWAAPQ